MPCKNDQIFLRALAGESTARKPVWVMRQAGRYLPEYRAIRKNYPNFLDFIYASEAAAEVTVQPVERFGMDAAILFSDILVLLPPMGVPLRFEEGRGPVVDKPVRDMEAVDSLLPVNVDSHFAPIGKTIALVLKRLQGLTPLLGFAGGPFTVASYMVEGGSSKELRNIKKLMFQDGRAYCALMDRLTAATYEYLFYQAEQGCSALVMMDSWAGYLSPEDYRQWVFPYTKMVLDRLRSNIRLPIIHYANGAGSLLPQICSAGFDGVGLDWRVNFGQTLAAWPQQVFQGNLDPSVLYASPETIRSRTHSLLAELGDRPHIMNLGHGVYPDTPIAGIEAFVDAIKG